MRLFRQTVLAAAVAVMAAGCSASTGGSGAASTPRSRRDLIQRAELEQTSITNLREAIQRLRPTWLRPRMVGSSTPQAPEVVIDNVRAGGLDRLETISVEMVQEVRFINARDATTRWGTSMTAGAIEVIMRRGG